MDVVSLFAGAGGLDLGFKKSGFNIVWANEYDKFAAATYRKNLGHHMVEGDICEVDTNHIPKADILIGGFPCQPFSVAGYRKGFEDERGELFWQIIKVANRVRPRVIVLENVKNLVNHNKGETFKTIVETLKAKKYNVTHKVLSSYEFGVPQTRQRIFIVAFKYKKDLANFSWPDEHKKAKDFRKMLIDKNVDEKYFYTNTKYNDMLKEKGTDSVLQIRRHYIRKNASKMFPTLTANMGMGGHNVPIIFDEVANAFRKITPREAFYVQGFPKNYKLPLDQADSRLYKQAGNAVTVNVAKALSKKIMEALNA